MIEYLHIQPFSLAALVLILAFMVDMIIGDPRWLIHPVQIIGRLISMIESLFRKVAISPSAQRISGILLAAAVISSVFLFSLLIFRSINHLAQISLYAAIASTGLLVYLTSTTIAAKGLLTACIDVMREVKRNNMEEARLKLSMIVGRDTERLSEDEVLKAAIETLAENLSDGMVAPVFYYLLGGFPLAMTYKAVNTLDSMVGYNNERYRYIGWASARIDDFANYIPARLTGVFIALAVFIITLRVDYMSNSLQTLIRDGRNHLSPNSGMPEAAMAGAIGVRLGGPSFYGGILVNKPYIGASAESDYGSAADKAVSIARVVSIISAMIFSFALIARGAL